MEHKDKDAAEQIELRDLHITGLCETVRQQQAKLKRMRGMLRAVVDAHDSIEAEAVSAALNDRTASTAPHMRFVHAIDAARKALKDESHE